ncbi:MAG: TetR/AcrR family transcriptional regulator C-terminal domain-containing protein, partial [Caulobacter sp.]|nr:TetR/AcrR family transcriptional regulator C-terminal domain-containing protein [Caulobacter sp.]
KSYSVLRVIIQGAGEMPDVAQGVFEAGPRQARRQLAAFLEMETQLGRLKVEDFDQAAEFFSGMVMGHSQLRSLLRLPSDKTAAEFDDLAREAARRFMRAYAP